MNKFFDIFNNTSKIPKEKINTCTFEILKNENLNRSRFTVNSISAIGWWPDEILRFLEVNMLVYIGFIQSYPQNPGIFDVALRNAIIYMNQPPYCNDNIICKLIKYDNMIIKNNYWTYVMEEDNCYMYEVEDRNRSVNENKHYLLLNAVVKLLSYDNITYDGLILKDEYIKLLYMYVTIYKIKNLHSMIDDILRKIIRSILDNNLLDIYMPDYFSGLLSHDYKYIINMSKKSGDSNLINKIYIFNDILLYALYRTISISYIFNSHKSKFTPYDMSNETELNIFDNKDYKQYKKYYGYNPTRCLSRIIYVYNLYVNRLSTGYNTIKMTKEINNFNLLIKSSESEKINRSITPRYIFSKSAEINDNSLICSVDPNCNMKSIECKKKDINIESGQIFTIYDGTLNIISPRKKDGNKIYSHKKRSASINYISTKK